MNEINNVQNLDQILFYTGEHSLEAASLTENRLFGESVEDYGVLTRNSDNSISFSYFSDVKYTEMKMDLQNLNDLYSNTLSYLVRTTADSEEPFSIGYTYIANNRYHAIYTYETDLKNDFDFAAPFVTRDLNDFLIGLNTQKYNKTNFYGDTFEVSSIKLDQTYFTWYPKDTTAYVITNEEIKHVDFTYFELSGATNGMYEGPWDGTEKVYLVDDSELSPEEREYTEFENISYLQQYAIENNLNIFKDTYSYDYSYFTYSNFKIGGETGNYYSYLRQSYETIDSFLFDKINNELDLFKDKYNHDESIYAYYMYDCHSNVNLMLTTQHLGVKQSYFMISFDSLFNKWFNNVININAELSQNDEILKITSANDDKIYSIFKNKIDRITGDNIVINKNETITFVTNSDISLDDEINILTPYEIDTLDLSPIKTKISQTINLNETPWKESGNHLRCLILDDGNNETKSNLRKIYGLNETSNLEYIDMNNVSNLSMTPALDKLENLKVFTAKNSNIDSFRGKGGLSFYYVGLPETIKSLKLMNNTFVSGSLMVAGEEKQYDGTLDYTPNSTLSNLTLVNIDNQLSYSLVTSWYDSLINDDQIDSFKYLELQGIKWDDISAQSLINLKKFDINPNLSGEVSIIGSGNYKWLTRNEYQNIRKLYGLNAFNVSNTISNKVFKNFNITPKKDKKETFEFSLKAKNNTLANYNSSLDETSTEIRFIDTLNVKIKGYYYDANHEEQEVSPYYNRAANSFLDIIYNDGINKFSFKKDDIDNFAYAKLERTIDTSNSDEIKDIKNGDILLFNGDTLIIYFDNVKNSPYEFIKLGNIEDISLINSNYIEESSLANWFDVEGFDEFEVEFIPSERETVIQELSLSLLSNDENIIYDTNEDGEENTEGIKIAIDIDEFAKEHFDDITNTLINIEYDNTILRVIQEESSEHHIVYSIKPVENYLFTSYDTSKVKVYCDANREDTEISIDIILRKRMEYSYVDGNTLVLSSLMYQYDEETQTLIINTQVATDTNYNEETRTLIMD